MGGTIHKLLKLLAGLLKFNLLGLDLLPAGIKVIGVFNADLEFLFIPWLGEIAVHLAFVDGIDDGINICVTREQNPDGIGEVGLNKFKKLYTAELGHHLV